ncbi:TPA: hypothetical protein CPT87_09725 [Candidatus Gastranaerophilales bacterium HUM_5]|nr:MAG TPA: hypothetical protein CPT99_07715 [Candidatus Gastranaerophilales bacterium HUM_4]DAA89214.1 MAG TPA: hypothetical protein CPT87_09725 [Candidatus Gastranaerophilales bacterium HUM_5]
MASSKKPSYISQKTFLQVHSLLEFDNLVGTSVYNKAVAEIENINEPRYYPQQIVKLIPEITSRKLNDWDAKGLLVKHRQNDNCWRLFSLADVIRLRIIQDLKTYGMSNIQIQKALNDIFELNDRKRQYLFETFLSVCATARKVVIIVEFDGSASFYLEDTAYVNLKMDKSCCKPVLILPFYDYCMPFMPHNEYKMTVTTSEVVSEQNRARIDAVADKLINNANKNINIERKNTRGKEYLIMKTTSTETNLNLSSEELMNRIKSKPYTKTIPFVDENGAMSITTEVTDKIK